jgi:hypothetical protein
MLVSELIDKLQGLKLKYGNLPVVMSLMMSAEDNDIHSVNYSQFYDEDKVGKLQEYISLNNYD